MTQLGLDVQAALVGPFNDLAYAAQLRDMAAQLNIQERIIFDTDNRQVELAYRGSNIFCLPSLNEGMPGSLIEAAASGLPAVVTTFSGAKECVHEAQTGFIITEGNRLAERIADIFCTIHHDPELARTYGRAARSHAVSLFSSDATWAAHENLFNRIIRGG
jgi:glycosyltransferase involved in cell wall biosynthesis